MKVTRENTIVLLLCVLPLLASAEIAVVTSQDNGVSELSEKEVKKLFKGGLRELGGEPVTLLDLPRGDDTREAFYRNLTGRSADEMRAHWSRKVFSSGGRPPWETSDVEDMKSRAASVGALGYLPAEEVDDDELQVLFRVPR